MRRLTLQLLPAVLVLGLGFTTALAEELRTIEVSAPAINCLFDPTCRVVVNDSTDTIPIGAEGPNFLQSRTFRGRPGSAAEGLYVYEYRIDLRRATGILHIPCLDSLSLDFGPIVRTLDLDGNGKNGDEVFVVTRGGLGSVGLASAEKSGNTITFQFSSPVCAGGRPGDGQSTFFFGLVSRNSPRQTTATLLESRGARHEAQVRAPRLREPLQQEIDRGAPVKEPISLPNSKSPRQEEVNLDALAREPISLQNRKNPLQQEIDRGAPVKEPISLQGRRRAAEANEAVVEGFFPRPCVDRGGQVTVFGSGFGEQQGGRLVELGGHGIGVLLRVTSWSGKRITAIVPNDRRIEQGQWYYIGLQNEDRHWISNISRTINICRGLE